MTTLRDLIRDVLSRHGLSMDDGVDGGLLIGKVTDGREGGDTKKVAVAIKTGFTQHWDIEDLKEQMDKAGISEGVFIALGNFSGKASDLAASSGIIIWERERFEREVGRVMLYQALGFQEIGEDDRDVTGVIGTKDMKGLGLTELVPEFSIETMDGVKVVPPTVVDIATGAASDGAAAEGKGSAPKVPPQQQAPQPTLPPGGLLLGMKVDKDGAAKIASDIVKNAFTVEPKIIPYHLFDFICLIEMKGLVPIVRRGLVGINALTGEPERWNRQLEDGASGLGGASFYGLVKGPPEMGADACTDRAKEFVQGINTITVAQK